MLQQRQAGGPASGRPCDCHEQQGRTHRSAETEESTPFNFILQNGKHRFQAFES